jgi:hypothetical protein
MDFISRIGGWFMGFRRADWEQARRRGVAGVALEGARSAVQANAPRIEFGRDAGWSGVEVERLLRRYGVEIFDRGFTDRTLWFRVTERQAGWADYLLRRAGVAVVTAPVCAGSAQVWDRYGGEMPPPWSGAETVRQGVVPGGREAGRGRARRREADDVVARLLDGITELLDAVAG